MDAVVYKSTYPQVLTQKPKYENPVLCDHVQAAASMQSCRKVPAHGYVHKRTSMNTQLYAIMYKQPRVCTCGMPSTPTGSLCPTRASSVLLRALSPSNVFIVDQLFFSARKMFSSPSHSFSRWGKSREWPPFVLAVRKILRWSEWFIVFNTHKCIFQCE